MVFEINLSRVTKGEGQGGDVCDDNAISANDGTFADGDPFHDVTSITDPGSTTDLDGTDIGRIEGGIGQAQIELAGMTIAVGDAAIIGDQHVIFDDDFAIDSEYDVPAELGAVANRKLWFIEESAALYRDFSTEPDIITDMNFCMAIDERKSVDGYIFTYGSAAALQQRVAVENSKKQARYANHEKVKFVQSVEQRVKYGRPAGGTRLDQYTGDGAEKAVKAIVTAFNFEEKGVHPEIFIMAPKRFSVGKDTSGIV